jgi:ribose 5-phosphate isomerase B
MNQKPIWIGNDHGGFVLKQVILKELEIRNIPYHDIGSFSTDIVRYPYYAAQVAHAVSTGIADRGILICSTGIGMSILANKYKNVRASECTDTYMGRITRAHNDSNILCLGGKVIGELEAIDILDVWLNTDYMGDRHNISLGLLAEAESFLCSNKNWEWEEFSLNPSEKK